MPKLIIKKDDLFIKKISIPEEILAFTVGEEQGNDIIIKDESVSFFHLQFEKQDDTYFVRDLQSQWGTFVNGQKITGRTIVKDNDEIGVGTHSIIFLSTVIHNKSSLYAKTYAKKPTLSDFKIEEKISGVPTLENLNSWIHQEEFPYNKNRDVFIEKENDEQYNSSNGFYNTNPRESSLNILENNNKYEHKPTTNYTNNSVPDFQDSVLSFESEPVIEQSQSTTDEPYFDDKITPLSENENNSDTETEKYYLLGIYGYYIGRTFKLKPAVTRIGRERKLNDIIIKKNSKGKIDQSVSRRQATITRKNNSLYISDKRSKSRTFVNQEKIEKNDEIQIYPGDEIEIISDRKSHILRLARKDDLDFSFPRKAGVWHVRYRIKLLNLYSIILLLLTTFIIINSFVSQNKISQRPEPLTVNETVWYSDAMDSEIIGGVESKTPRFPAIADFDGDKIIDLIYIDESGFLICINGQSKQPMWINTDFESILNIPITVEDLNKNNIADVIVVSKDYRLRAIDGSWGIEIWKSPILEGPLTGPPVVGDFNGDGLKDLAITSYDRAVYIGFSSFRNSRWIKIDTKAQVQSIASAADLTGDGILNVLVGTESGKILVIDGIQEKITREIDINEEFNKASGSYYQNNQIRHPVVLGDLNGDSVNDIIVSTLQGNILVLNGGRLERLWYDLASSNSIIDPSLNGSIALGDLDGDKLLDIISLTPDGRLHAFKGFGRGKDRKMILWSFPAIESEYFIGSPVLADFNKNGTQDVIISNSIGNIFIIEGATGKILWHSDQSNFTVLGSPLISDLDGDNHLDVLVQKSDDKFYKLSTNSLILDNTVVWGQMYNNSRHTNKSSFQRQNVFKYYGYIGISLLVSLSIISLNIVFRKKRKKLSKIQEFV